MQQESTGLLVPYKGNKPYVFISYSHRNSNEVLKIISRIQQLDFRVWYDNGIEPGTEWDENIASHISGCSYFIAFISEQYLASPNCKDELNFARDNNKQLLLVYISSTNLPNGMSMRLNRIQAIYKYTYTNEIDFYQKLVEADGIKICRSIGEGSRNQACVSYAVNPTEAVTSVPTSASNTSKHFGENNKGRKKAVVALICSIVAILMLVGACYISLVLGVIAIVLSILASKEGYAGKEGKAGKIIGIINTVISGILVLFM